MMKWWLVKLSGGVAGCHVRFEGDGAGGAGSAGGDPASREATPGRAEGTKEGEKGAGGAGGGEDVSGLKSALEKERTTRKALSDEVKSLRQEVEAAKSGSKTLEELQGKLGETTKKLEAYEAREARTAALDAALAEATKGGLTVDVERARKFVERVGGDPASAAKEAVELFGVPASQKATPGQGSGAGAGARAFAGQPDGEKKAAAVTKVDELVKLSKENPEAYRQAVAERRKSIPFFSGT